MKSSFMTFTPIVSLTLIFLLSSVWSNQTNSVLFSSSIVTPMIDNISQKWLRSSHGKEVNIYRLHKGSTEIGHAIWMKRDKGFVGAKYFAFKERYRNGHKNVFDRFQDWKEDKTVILACSGAFSTEMPGQNDQNAITVGLTVDNGRMVNRNIEDRMDGLVIVYPSGGIVVSDIDNRNLKIGRKIIDIQKDKTELLHWAQSNQATIFQTHLLAYNNSLRISRMGRNKNRERRFLALAQDKRGSLYHIIFDLPRNNFLFDAARDVFYFLKEEEKMNVVALLNLDTGAYNILDLFMDDGQKDHNITGGDDIKKSTNLIVYHYSK